MTGRETMTSQARVEPGPSRVGWESGKLDSKRIATRAGFASALPALVRLPLLIASNAFAQSTQFRLEDIRAAWRAVGVAPLSSGRDLNDPVSALAAYIRKQEHIGHGVGDGEENHLAPARYVRHGQVDAPMPIKADLPHERSGEPPDDAHAALADFVRGINSGEPAVKFAQANAPAKKAKAAVKAAPVDGQATLVGSQACLGCHASHRRRRSISTIMGRIFTQSAQRAGSAAAARPAMGRARCM